METIFAILTVIVYILLALVGLVALTICVFLWMVSTRTRQDSKIFQERFDGWRKTRREVRPESPAFGAFVSPAPLRGDPGARTPPFSKTASPPLAAPAAPLAPSGFRPDYSLHFLFPAYHLSNHLFALQGSSPLLVLNTRKIRCHLSRA